MCVGYCSLLCKTIVIVVALILLGLGISSYVVASMHQHRTSTLAIASDVIECAKPNLLYRYSRIVVNETPSDPVNDNPKGLIMDLFTLDKNDIKYHVYLDNRNNFELVLPTTGVNRFIMPYNYYNRPWYLWAGSTIDITYRINYKQKPTKAILYLFKGDTSINSFFSKTKPIPRHEQQIDMLSVDGISSIHWQVQHNEYYFVGVHTVGAKDTIFKANMTFNFTYIDVDDYSWLKNTAQRANGVNHPLTLYRSISSWSTNKTLCYLHALPDNSLDSDSIHVDTDYFTDETLKALLIAIPFSSFILYFLVVLGCYWLCKTSRTRKEKHGYFVIN